jgi:mannose-6-phosphate isomerase-like protein (cupin superfamily)
MYTEKLRPGRGTVLRKNGLKQLIIDLKDQFLENIFLINGNKFLTTNILKDDLFIAPQEYYMIISKADIEFQIKYNLNITFHRIIYDPYKFEDAKKEKIDPDKFRKTHIVPEGFTEILSKWYSIKFTYPDYNLIFIKPEMGISFQIHRERSEYWEILDGRPIILSGNRVYYFVESDTLIENPVGNYHSIINPNTKKDKFVVIKERWSGNFDEEDIKRVFNPNHYESKS